VSSLSAGQARNIDHAKNKLIELAKALKKVGLTEAGDEINAYAESMWVNADALYCEILSLEADNKNISGGRRKHNISEGKSVCPKK
jgi:hypothetical protein